MTRKNQGLTSTERLQRRRAAAQENGSEGGLKRAEYYDSEVLSEWASKGGRAVLAKYGREYFVELRKRRKAWLNDIQRDDPAAFEKARVAARARAARRNGQRGGLARAALYNAEQRSEWARKGGLATRARYGNDLYRKIRKLRKRYCKGYLTRKTEERLRETFTRTVSSLANDDHLASLGRFLAERQQASPRTLLEWSLLRTLEHSLPPSDK